MNTSSHNFSLLFLDPGDPLPPVLLLEFFLGDYAVFKKDADVAWRALWNSGKVGLTVIVRVNCSLESSLEDLGHSHPDDGTGKSPRVDNFIDPAPVFLSFLVITVDARRKFSRIRPSPALCAFWPWRAYCLDA